MRTRTRLCCVLCILFASFSNASSQLIHTVAGGGPANNTAGTSAAVVPLGVVADASGNLYFASGFDGSVYKLSSGLLTRVAGEGASGYAGDGGPATAAVLNNPSGLALDAAGHLYITDSGNSRIRVVNTQASTVSVLGVTIAPGDIATVAGSAGTAGYSGDGGPATSAKLNNPAGIAVDASGNLYIADTFNQVIRKVVPSGIITTVAGTGGFPDSGDGGPATSAQIEFPGGVAVDAAGNFYITDGGYRVRAVNTQSSGTTLLGVPIAPGTIATVAGNGTAGYSGDGGAATSAQITSPGQATIDAAGNLYISDTFNCRVREVDTGGTITTVAGNGTLGFTGDGGAATSAEIDDPIAVTVDTSGNLYIADRDNDRIRKVDTGGTITTVAGNGTFGYSGDGGPATSAQFQDPFGVAVDAAHNLYIADYDERVRAVNTQASSITVLGVTIAPGNIATVAGSGKLGYGGDGGAATSASLSEPGGVAVDAHGNLYIADTFNDVIRKVNTSGTISTLAGTGTAGSSGDGGPATSAELSTPYGVAVDAAGNVYIPDTFNYCVRVVNTQATSMTLLGVAIGPGDIATVAGTIGSSGYSGDGGAATSAQLKTPYSVAVDAAGNLYIADSSGDRVRKVDTSGNISTVAGNGTSGYTGDGGAAASAELSNPVGVAVDAAGNLYITDGGNERIRVVNTQASAITVLGVSVAPGDIATVAGNGTQNFSGDGGAATSAELSNPDGIAVDGAGNVYIVDYNNRRIRRVDSPQTGTVQVTVGTTPAGLSFSVDGTSYTSAQTLTWSIGSSHTIATTSPQTSGGTENTFASWSDAGALSHSVTAPSTAKTYTASFNTSYLLTTAANPTIGGTVAPVSGTFYPSGTVVNLTATANSGYAFTSWTGSVANANSAATTIAMTAPETVSANFQTNSVQVTVGTTPAGLSFSVDGTSYTSAQTLTWSIGSSHTIATTSPQTSGGTENTFASWSDAGALSHSVTAPSTAKTYTASFNTSYLLTTAANPTIGGTVAPVSGTFYPSGTVVNLTATANSGYAFTSWTGSVANANSAATTIAMTAPESVSANFQTNTVQVTVGTTPAGLSFSVDGTSYTSAQTLTWSIGSSHTIATTSPQTSGGTENTFASWSDAGALSHSVTAPSTAKTYTASFNTSYLLTTAANPTIGGTVAPVSGTFYPSGTVVNLTATANSGYAFTSWTGSVANANSASTTVAMTAPESVSANFQTNTVQVTVGTTPAGLSFSVDGTSYTSTQTLTWSIGSSHTIATTSPQTSGGTQNTFASWSDAGALSHSVTAPSTAKTYTASFNTSYLLTTAANPTIGGTVSPVSGTFYPSGTVVNLTATANSGYAFTSWTGSVANANSAATTIAMTAPESVSANFQTNTVQVTVGTTPAGLSFSVDGTSYTSAQTLTWSIGSSHIIATTSPQTSGGTENTFASWSDAGALSHSVTAPSTAKTYTASFNTSYLLTTAANPTIGGTVSPVSGTFYPSGTVVNLTATANSGYAFTSWTGSVANANSAATTVAMTAPETVSANFQTNTVQVTVGTTPAGLSFSVDGTSYTSAQTLTWSIGSSHTIATTSPQTSGGTENTFAFWSDAGALSHSVTAPSTAKTYTASFNTSYLLTTAANPTIGGTVSPVSGTFYPSGTVVNLTATANSGYAFTSWTGSVANANSAATTIAMTAPETVSANFQTNTVQVTVGTIPAGLSFSVDGTSYSSAKILTWSIGSSHTIATTSPQTSGGTENTFASWSDAGALSHSVTAPSTAKTYTASFNTSYLLTTAANPTIGGTVSPVSGTFYPSGTVVNLMATANSGYAFTNWTGSVANANSAATTVAMTAPESVSANFSVVSSTGLSFTPSSISFGTVTLWGGTSQYLTVTNHGSTTITFNQISLGSLVGATRQDLTYDGGCMSALAPGKTCKITLSLWPSQVGNVSAVLTLQDSAAGSPQHVLITATVIAPKADADPPSLSFGSEALNGTSTAQTVTLSNPGVGPLTISGLALGGQNSTDFLVQSTTCGSSLAQGLDCTINVAFRPRATGSRSATLKFTDDAQSGTQTVSLSGRGH